MYMNKYTFLVVGLVVGLVGGYAGARGMSQGAMTMDHSMGQKPEMPMSGESQVHMHEMIELDGTKPVPTLALQALPDSKDGYNIQLQTTNFLFTPEKVGGAPVVNEGHAHLFINGKKIGRLYGPWVNIGKAMLSDGENVIEVTLNANDHSDWAYMGNHISAKVSVTR